MTTQRFFKRLTGTVILLNAIPVLMGWLGTLPDGSGPVYPFKAGFILGWQIILGMAIAIAFILFLFWCFGAGEER